MTQPLWDKIDGYFADRLLDRDPVLDDALAASDAAGLPQIAVSPLIGKFLYLLRLTAGARRILEIGTLGGYSTIWLGRALPTGGRLVSLEHAERHAEVARSNLSRAQLSDKAEVRVGPALDLLPQLQAERFGPVDLAFIDADKQNNWAYVDWSIRLGRPGTVIVVDNVVREGRVVDEDPSNASVTGVRRMMDQLAEDARVEATALQLTGVKGHDGFALIRVR
ncbi:MAG: O-methyltransferase [Azospirillaceae bacterium]